MKRTILRGLHLVGAFGALRHLRRNAAVIVCYHGVMPGDDDSYQFLNANFVSTKAFEQQMQWLASRYRLVPLRHIVEAIDQGAALPARAATVTFDDGFANNYRTAFPVLRRLGIPTTIFLATEKIGVPGAQIWTERVKRAIYLTPKTSVTLHVGGPCTYQLPDAGARERGARLVLSQLKRATVAQRDEWLAEIESVCGRPSLQPNEAMRYDFLTWDQVREMAAAGIEFGSHTVSHPILTSLDDDRLAFELSESKKTIESQLGRECYAFAYPNGGFGDFGPREMAALKGAGYRCALSLEGGLVRRTAERFALDRTNVAREYALPLLNATLTGAMADLRSLTGRRSVGPAGV